MSIGISPSAVELDSDEVEFVREICDQLWSVREVQTIGEWLGVTPQIHTDDWYDDMLSELSEKVSLQYSE